MKTFLSLLLLLLSGSTSLQGERKPGSVRVAIRGRGIRAALTRRDQSLDEIIRINDSGEWLPALSLNGSATRVLAGIQRIRVELSALAVPTTGHTAILAPSQSFFGTAEDNLVITAMKKDEDDNSLLIRCYEWAGKKGDVHIALPRRVTAARETNLMDRSGLDRQDGCGSNEPIRN
jgi:hypothetical protein